VDDRRAEVRRLSDDAEVTLDELAERVGASRSTVYADLVALGIPRRARGGAGHRISADELAARDERRDRVRELYVDHGQSAREVATELGCSQSTVLEDLGTMRIERRPSGGVAKYEAPAPRECANPKCRRIFTLKYPSDAVAPSRSGEWGRFCSAACRVEGIRKHEPALERSCATCGRSFRPAAAALLRGGGRGTYCSMACRRRGVTITCAQCGAEAYMSPSRSSARFCSSRCWGLYSWEHTLRPGLVESLHARGLLRGLAASRLTGRVNARRYIERARAAGTHVGRPRGYDSAQEQRVFELRERGKSIRGIAIITGLTRRQVEKIASRRTVT
jgi:hypothetical protein